MLIRKSMGYEVKEYNNTISIYPTYKKKVHFALFCKIRFLLHLPQLFNNYKYHATIYLVGC